MAWVDLAKADTFGQVELPTVPPSARCLKLSNLSAKHEYQQRLKDWHRSTGFCERLSSLAALIEVEPLNPDHEESLSKLDGEQKDHKLDSEKNVERSKQGLQISPPWSMCVVQASSS